MVAEYFTQRLKWAHIKNKDVTSRDFLDFHRVWSDPIATCWSIRGTSQSIEESQQRICEFLPPQKNYAFAIYHRVESQNPGSDAQTAAQDAQTDEKWEVVGIISMVATTPIFPLTAPPGQGTEPQAQSPATHVFAVGYMLLKTSWGKGYTAEVTRSLLDNFREFLLAADPDVKAGDQVFVHAIVSPENPQSLRVIDKVGLPYLGIKEFEQGAFLAGAWRGNKTLAFGRYV